MGPQLERITADWETYSATAFDAAEQFGVNIDLDLGDARLTQIVAGVGVAAEGATFLATELAALSSTTASATGVSFATAGPVVAGIALAVLGSLRVVRLIDCGRDARRARDRYSDYLRDITDLVLPPDAPDVWHERLNFRLREAMTYVSQASEIPESRGRLQYGGWNDRRPPSGMTWTDGSTANRRGVDRKFGGEPCKKKAAMIAMREAAAALRSAVEEQPTMADRGAVVISLLGFYLGNLGDPFQGLEDAFISTGVPFAMHATRMVGFGELDNLDARQITELAVFRRDDPSLFFTHTDAWGGVGSISWPVTRAGEWVMVVRFADGSRFATLEYVDRDTLRGRFNLPTPTTLQARPDEWPMIQTERGVIYTWGIEGRPDPSVSVFLQANAELVHQVVPGLIPVVPLHARLYPVDFSKSEGGGLLLGAAALAGAWFLLR